MIVVWIMKSGLAGWEIRLDSLMLLLRRDTDVMVDPILNRNIVLIQHEVYHSWISFNVD